MQNDSTDADIPDLFSAISAWEACITGTIIPKGLVNLCISLGKKKSDDALFSKVMVHDIQLTEKEQRFVFF